jgi:uncharacterized phiE125 gp8 family phage protein
MSLMLKTAPALEPITLVEAKRHLRVDLDFLDDDQYISALISAARATVEAWEWRSHVNQVWELRLDAFPASAQPIYCPRPPLQSVGSIQYVDADGVTQTLSVDDYVVDPKSEPGRIMPAYGEVWPTTRPTTMNAVTITYTAGYGPDAQNVPVRTKHAIKLLLGLWYENREPVVTGTIATRIPETIEALLLPVHSVNVLQAVG